MFGKQASHHFWFIIQFSWCPHYTTGDGGDESGVKPSLKMNNLADLARMSPIIWHRNLLLKHTLFPAQIHVIGGNVSMANGIVEAKGHREDMNVLHFTQRLHFDPPQLKDLNERIASGARHCILLAVPAAIPDSQSSNSSTSLQPLEGLISHLDKKTSCWSSCAEQCRWQRKMKRFTEEVCL